MQMYFILNRQTTRSQIYHTASSEFLNWKTQGSKSDEFAVAPPSYSSLLAEYFKPEAMPTLSKRREVVGKDTTDWLRKCRFSDANWTWVLKRSKLKSAFTFHCSKVIPRFWKITELPRRVSDNFIVNF